jgi:hypothetical protein
MTFKVDAKLAMLFPYKEAELLLIIFSSHIGSTSSHLIPPPALSASF